MPTTGKNESKGTGSMPAWFQGMGQFDGAFGDNLKRTQAAFQQGFCALSDEVLHFARTRLDRDSEVIGRCRECRDIADLMNIQRQWFEELIRDYYDEAFQMNGTMRKIATEGFGMAPITGETRPRPGEVEVPRKAA